MSCDCREIDGYVGINSDVTEEREYEEHLEVLNRVVRHDIKNEVNIIDAYTRRLLEADDVPPGHVEPILESCGSVANLTDSVRALLETVQYDEETSLSPVPLVETVTGELRAVDDAYSTATLSLETDVDGDVRVAANDLLSSVVRNLLENAVVHSDREEPTIDVSVTADGEDVRLEVADDGPGVPEDRREDVFGRGEKGLESPGTGVGLYLVDALVDQYGGEVSIEDNDPRGTVVVVRLHRAAGQHSSSTGESVARKHSGSSRSRTSR